MGSDSSYVTVKVKVKGETKVWKKDFENSNKGIILRGTTNERYKILYILNALTNDELGMDTVYPSGNCYVIIKEFNVKYLNRKLLFGTKLIRDLIQQESTDKTVEISIVDGEKESDASTDDWTNAENGIGANAIVNFNPTQKVKFLVKDNDTGKGFWENLIPHIVLAHELIHAYHIVNGISKLGRVNYTYEYIDKETNILQKKIEHSTDIEELYTMGVSEYEWILITENKIRKEQEENERIGYKYTEQRRAQ